MERRTSGIITPDERAGVDLSKVWLQGVHYGLDWEEYFGLPYLNASRLKWGSKSARHLKAALDGEMDGSGDTPDRLFGRALHCRLLEPDLFLKRFVVTPGCQGVMKSGKAKGSICGSKASYLVQGEWLCGVHVPKSLVASGLLDKQQDILSQDEAKRVEDAAKSVQRHAVVKLLRLRGGYEATVLFELHGHKCKARLDKLIPSSEHNPWLILDVKKTQLGGADDTSCERACHNYGYDVQAAFYRQSLASTLGVSASFIWVYVEDSPPYEINVIQADQETLIRGREKLDDCLCTYERCQKSGYWPGYMDGHTKPKLGGLPKWERAGA